jgi:hypothetical protein
MAAVTKDLCDRFGDLAGGTQLGRVGDEDSS